MKKKREWENENEEQLQGDLHLHLKDLREDYLMEMNLLYLVFSLLWVVYLNREYCLILF